MSRSEKVFKNPADQKAFDEARAVCIDQWRRKVGRELARGGYFCFGPVDGGCGICHERADYAIDCLQRFRINKGGGYSDRAIYSGSTGKPLDSEKRPAGTFSPRGRFNGAGAPEMQGAGA